MSGDQKMEYSQDMHVDEQRDGHHCRDDIDMSQARHILKYIPF